MRIALLGIVLLAGTASAQPTLGVRASGVYSTASVHPEDASFSISIGNAVGVGAGLFAEMPLTPVLTVVGDLGYVQGGAFDEFAVTSPDSPEPTGRTADGGYHTHAVTVAPALSAALRTDDVEPFLFVGPRIDVKLFERSTFNGETSSSDAFPDVALGVAGGAGVAVGRGRLDVRASRLWGDGAIRQAAVELRVGVTL